MWKSYLVVVWYLLFRWRCMYIWICLHYIIDNLNSWIHVCLTWNEPHCKMEFFLTLMFMKAVKLQNWKAHSRRPSNFRSLVQVSLGQFLLSNCLCHDLTSQSIMQQGHLNTTISVWNPNSLLYFLISLQHRLLGLYLLFFNFFIFYAVYIPKTIFEGLKNLTQSYCFLKFTYTPR